MNTTSDMIVNVDVTHCASGNVVGVMREWPIVAQAKNISDLNAKMWYALINHLAYDKYLEQNSDTLTECISLKIIS